MCTRWPSMQGGRSAAAVRQRERERERSAICTRSLCGSLASCAAAATIRSSDVSRQRQNPARRDAEDNSEDLRHLPARSVCYPPALNVALADVIEEVCMQ